MPSKEAVVFVIDASASMADPLPHDTVAAATTGGTSMIGQQSASPLSKLCMAKNAVLQHVAQLMLQSKQNEVCVVVFPTASTTHHKIAAGQDVDEEDDVPFAHISELTNGVVRPTPQVLRDIVSIRPLSAGHLSKRRLRHANVMNALLLAADALREQTYGKVFRRRIVVWTDALHDIAVNAVYIPALVKSLNDDKGVAALDIVGLHLWDDDDRRLHGGPVVVKSEIDNGEKMEETPHVSIKKESRDHDSDSATDDGINPMEVDSEDEGDERDLVVCASKKERIELLQNVANAVNTSRLLNVTHSEHVDELLPELSRKGVKRPTLYKLDLHIAPNIVLPARQFKLYGDDKPPTLKYGAWVTGDEKSDKDGGMVYESDIGNVESLTRYVVKGNIDEGDVIEPNETTKAVFYGADLLVISEEERKELAKLDNEKESSDSPNIRVIGYVPLADIPQGVLAGAPYIITGHDSTRTCAGIAALAQSLQSRDKAAICTFKKQARGGKHLGALLPYKPAHEMIARHLAFMSLPWAGEQRDLDMNNFDRQLARPNGDAKLHVADRLVAALTLPRTILEPGKVPSPLMEAWNSTLVRRAMDEDADVVAVRTFDDRDAMMTPQETLKRAEAAMKKFRETFPVAKTDKKDSKNAGKRKGRQMLNYRDYL